MGSRGASSGVSTMSAEAMSYTPYQYGQITRREAGVIYKAVKNGDVEAKPETTKELYEAADAYVRYASERYSQDHLYYDRIYDATRAILNNDFKSAQKTIRAWEQDNIYRASKKSKWYKYQTDKDRKRWARDN